ncbi:peptidase C39 family protein [Deinococcus sp. KNUC1210]|uniref:peptidase C39 family protein n=1 Tax=Deinococcus sp. KNUC1210 TaxID=2917691 RepID=UPI001EEF79DA|nr:peptidase C39 family protein [Deinococcus sp. KNUC1210]ULH16813.1 peptidase C39 family protein [Deinococcus sp. KNUC1210]
MRFRTALLTLSLTAFAQTKAVTPVPTTYATTTVLTDPAALLPDSSHMLTGPETTAPPFDELIPSWNAVTPPGSSVTVEVRTKSAAGQWSRWFSFGSWMSAGGKGDPAGRTSVDGQKDASGTLNTDTLSLTSPATVYQSRVTLRGAARLTLLAFTTSRRTERTAQLGSASDRAAWGKVLKVPQRSQMLYPGGGEVWCSPTSTSMILGYYGVNVTVPQAAAATYDRAYDGTGNWPFNTAYAGSLGLRAYVSRLPSLSAAEPYILAGIPLAVSLGWKAGELPGAAVPSSSGHLMVLVGFDSAGNPVLNDPAAPTDAGVKRSYPRAAFERLWLKHSGGTVYVIAPAGKVVP